MGRHSAYPRSVGSINPHGTKSLHQQGCAEGDCRRNISTNAEDSSSRDISD